MFKCLYDNIFTLLLFMMRIIFIIIFIESTYLVRVNFFDRSAGSDDYTCIPCMCMKTAADNMTRWHSTG